MWEVYLTDEVNRWLDDVAVADAGSHRQVVFAIEALTEGGPNLGRPLVDRIKGSSIHNLKELRPGSSGGTEMRILLRSIHGAVRCCWWRGTSRVGGGSGTGRRSRRPSSCTRGI